MVILISCSSNTCFSGFRTWIGKLC